jgi:uncharacterized protein (TIGR03083 family)
MDHAMNATTTLPDLIRAQREGFIATLEELTPEQWLVPSLCTQWRVVDVAAHLAWAPVTGATAGAAALVRNGFSTNRMLARLAVGWSARGRSAILEQLRDNARTGARPFPMPPIAALADAVVHGLDVRRPLGLPREVPTESLAPLAAFAFSTPWPLNAVVGGSARRRVAGVRLVATDADWTHGTGPEVRASAEDLLLVLHGRAPRPEDLSGPGAATLLARL